MKTIYSRFYAVLITVILLILASISLFNILVDPYGVFNSPLIQGFNQSKPWKVVQVRLFKAVDLTRIKPQTVLLGASRTYVGLNPKHPALNRYQPSYNLGLNSANMYEMKRYFQHALFNQPDLKLVVLEIDYFSFYLDAKNTPDFSEDRLEKSSILPKDLLNSTLSMDALINSISTILHNSRDSQKFLFVNGMVDVAVPNQPISITTFTLFLTRHNYSIGSNYLKDFEYVVKTCRDRGIELKIFISPIHVLFSENIRATGNWPMYERWKREIVKIAPVWDFSGYNSITTEKYSDRVIMKNYTDVSHYTIPVGNLILNRLFNYQEKTVPTDFGVLITPNNIESHLDKINAQRQVWAKQNPDAVEFIRSLQTKK
ncbi:MAG: hypothetical protein WBV73_12105 [Phormidium sp.]